MTEELSVKEKESLLTRAASLVVKNAKDRKKIHIWFQGFIWGAILGVVIVIFASVKP